MLRLLNNNNNNNNSNSNNNVSLDVISSLGEATQIVDTEEDRFFDDRNLNFSGVGLIARQEELEQIRAAFQRVCCCRDDTNVGRSEAVMVSGTSGTGKSSLVESLRNPVTITANGFYVSGKFDQVRNEPFSGIVEAFSDLCDLVIQEHEENELREIVKHLETEYQVLNKLVPNLSRLRRTSNESDAADDDDSEDDDEGIGAVSGMSGKDVFARFKFACRKFMQAMSSLKHPVLLFFDDLQWADDASIDVIRSLLTNQDSQNVLYVCSYRSDYQDFSASALDLIAEASVTTQDNTAKETKGSGFMTLTVTTLKLENFGLDDVDMVVSTLLDLSHPKTRELAELILRRTHGNPYFVIQFLQYLESRGLIFFSKELSVWDWDLAEIQSETSASDNVVEVLSQRIQQLPVHVQSILRIAACLGYKFDRTALRIMVDKLLEGPHCFDDSLQIAEEMGLIEGDGKRRNLVSFSHDRVHQCLYLMTPETDNERPRLHLNIAKSLQLLNGNMMNREALACVIADQLNRARKVTEDETDQFETAMANLDAVKVAVSKSAISVAAQYVDQGILALENMDAWRTHYKLCLDLYTSGAQVYFCSGRFDDCAVAVKEVEDHAKSFEHGLKAQIMLVNALASKGELREAVELAFSLSRNLGYKLPKNPGFRHIVIEVIKTKKLLKGMSDSDLLKQTSNRKDNDEIYRLLGHASECASLATMIPHLCVAVLKMMQLSISRGNATPPTYASYGVLESVMGNHDEAYRFGRLAVKLQTIQKERRMVPFFVPLVHMFFNHSKCLLRDSLEPLMEAYEIGMEKGEIDSCFMSIQTYLLMAFHCGMPLVEVERVNRMYCRQMSEFDHRSQAILCLPYWQIALNLTGMSESHSMLTGEAMDVNKLSQEVKDSGNLTAGLSLQLAKIILFYLLEDVGGLSSTILTRETRAYGSHYTYSLGLAYVCLGCAMLFRCNPRKRIYRRHARKMLRRLERFEKQGFVNCIPLAALCRAEVATLSPRQRRHELEMQALYDSTIEVAANQELIHIQAIASERAGDFFHSSKALDLAAQYLYSTIELYDRWGSPVKVHHVSAKYPSIFALEENGDMVPIKAVTTTIDTLSS